MADKPPYPTYTDCGGLPEQCGGTCDGCIERAAHTLPAIYTVSDNDACCEDCRKHKIRDVYCAVCKELYVTDQDELDSGYVPECWNEHAYVCPHPTGLHDIERQEDGSGKCIYCKRIFREAHDVR